MGLLSPSPWPYVPPYVGQWRYVTQRFEGLLKELQITAAQAELGEARHRAIRAALNLHYWNSLSETDNSILIGSWGKRTRVRPPRDIDIMFFLPAAVLAAIIPPLHRALGLDTAIDLYARLSAEFKNLEGSFTRAARIGSHKALAEFEAETVPLFTRLDAARKPSATPPELCFRLARRKIRAGHYSFDH